MNSVTPTLQWSGAVSSSCTAISGYNVEVHTTGDCTALQTSGSVSTTGWTTPSLANGTYYRRVRAIDSQGGIGSWSSCRAFSVDTVAPTTAFAANTATCSS